MGYILISQSWKPPDLPGSTDTRHSALSEAVVKTAFLKTPYTLAASYREIRLEMNQLPFTVPEGAVQPPGVEKASTVLLRCIIVLRKYPEGTIHQGSNY